MQTNIKDILEVQGIKAKGFGIIPKLVMLDTRISIEAKAIYSYFCSYAGTGTTVFPSRKKILNDLCISKDRYYKHFNLLKELGYITVKQVKKNNIFKHNIYTLVENPNPVNTSCPDFKDTVPCPCFTDTENKDTNNNISIINNNNIINNNKEKTPNRNTKDIKNVVVENQKNNFKLDNINQEYVQQVKDIIIENISDKDIIKILEVSKNNLEVIKEKYTLIKSSNIKINNLVGLLLTSIIKDFRNISIEPNQQNNNCHTSKSKNKFMNYEQREWNFEELEKLEYEYMINYGQK